MAPSLALLLVTVAAGIALVRAGWRGRRATALSGWAVTIAALAVLAASAGAWGVAIGLVVATLAALAITLWAGWRSPRRAWRAKRDAPSVAPPRDRYGFVRRLLVFLLVMPAAAAASFWLVFGLQAVGRSRAGMVDADATALVLLGFPVIWCGLMAWQMTRSGPRAMIASPAIAGVAGTLLWLAR